MDVTRINKCVYVFELEQVNTFYLHVTWLFSPDS